MCGQLPEEHDRCQTAASEAALALAVHVAERRLGAALDRPAEPRTFDYTKGIPQQADLSLIVAVRERVSGNRRHGVSATQRHVVRYRSPERGRLTQPRPVGARVSSVTWALMRRRVNIAITPTNVVSFCVLLLHAGTFFIWELSDVF
jgi:hypothetical protein